MNGHTEGDAWKLLLKPESDQFRGFSHFPFSVDAGQFPGKNRLLVEKPEGRIKIADRFLFDGTKSCIKSNVVVQNHQRFLGSENIHNSGKLVHFGIDDKTVRRPERDR